MKPDVSRAFVVVRNLGTRETRLDFGEFTVSVVGLRFKKFRELFSSVDVEPDDWILEKSYGPLDRRLIASRPTSRIFCFFCGSTT